MKRRIVIQEDPGLSPMRRVKLVPRVKLGDGVIKGIRFGRARTPSPFGGPMGDHTSSWASVVDSVHASLYGRSLPDALQKLSAMQDAVQEWMNSDTSEGSKLFDTLAPEDQDKREKALGHYAATVKRLVGEAKQHLGQAPPNDPAAQSAAQAAAAKLLADAVGHHLAYVNFLPFATVRAGSDRGSIGSGEGEARAAVLDAEFASEENLDEVEAQNPGHGRHRNWRDSLVTLGTQSPDFVLRAEIWKLFSLEAAVRAADLEHVVAPERAKKTAEKLDALKTMGDGLGDLVDVLLVEDGVKGPDGKTSRRTKKKDFTFPDGGVKITLPARTGQGATGVPNGPEVVAIGSLQDLARVLDKIEGRAVAQVPDRSGAPELWQMRVQVTGLTKKLRGIMGEVTPGLSDELRAFKDGIKSTGDDMAEESRRLREDPDRTREDPARMLAHLLHDFQSIVVRSYPGAASKAGFLGGSAADSAVNVLKEHLDKAGLAVEPAMLDAFLDKVKEFHTELGEPEYAVDARWIAEAGGGGLLVAIRNGKLEFGGRPDAPVGIAGMGSHTTSWVTECAAVEQWFKEKGEAGIGDHLRKQVIKDLKGELMTDLAPLLPNDQLSADQLTDIFEAARAALEAEAPEDTIEAYLSFRNLLPYATVDAGNRDGQGERATASKGVNFDEESLEAAMALKQDELDNPGTAIAVLQAAATSLRNVAPDLAGPAAPKWQKDFLEAVDTTIAGLDHIVRRLKNSVPQKAPAAPPTDPTGKTKKKEKEKTKAEMKKERLARKANDEPPSVDDILQMRDAEHNAVWKAGHPGKKTTRPAGAAAQSPP
ncbi:hypothetical protein OG884_34805 [Streptosporangium sp. NBC_01755]|uniref:hypothetical protein n=1 Tax=unclassified Streptosporangium TaxID=2632669 RepID=UPI002DD876DE|nr:MULTISPECIES: hypothetical protein [unclassified Streptosporangium]WSA28649.1 hypothetical protein OIE13_12665 [Streptosporangium sp. NBC_01810]WSC99899.1 hypothetical protein OG884_34805 [Streptosporangium sp. NBC_01755]